MMLSRNEEGDPVNNFGIDAAYSASPGGGGGGGANGTHGTHGLNGLNGLNGVNGGSGGSGGSNGVSRSSLGNYNALLSLSRMGSKEDDCNFPFISTALEDSANFLEHSLNIL